MTDNTQDLDVILAKHGAEPGEMTHSLKQAIKSLISKSYMRGLTDATADPNAMTPKEVFERNQRINGHSKRSEQL